ncbi:beta-galactosidase [Clostridia bacterium]|nr:beta-galactosidase [Clostridia bacterium]
MNGTFFTDNNGKPIILTGLQAHNSSTGSPLIDKAIDAVIKFGGNVLEAPVYWYRLEPEKGVFDYTHVRELIQKTRAAWLKLIILWFGANKNGHPNYVPEYIKLDPITYRLARYMDGTPAATLSSHCAATLEADKTAFRELMKCIKDEDAENKTVIAVQVENEVGLANTDRDYSPIGEADFNKPVPNELLSLKPSADCGAKGEDDSWRGRFGRYANEFFSAFHHAKFIDELAKAGKAVYDIPMTVNAMIGNTYSEGGRTYNSGGPTGKVLDVWKIAAPNIDLLCPDIYMSARDDISRVCREYARSDNALFIPETIFFGEAASVNMIREIAEYGAIGVCGFGAEGATDENGELRAEVKRVSVTVKTINAIAPLLIKYRGTGRIFPIIQEEFAHETWIQLEDFYITAKFNTRYTDKGEDKRGRAILVRTAENEFYLAGTNAALDFQRRPLASDDRPFVTLSSRQANQLNFLTVEEGRFEGDKWVAEFYRNGDESNFELYVRGGEIVRLRLNPNIGMKW